MSSLERPWPYGSDGHRKIVERWGDDILKADGGLDRVALRQIVFQEPTELEALNSIVHPEVSRLRDDLINEARERGDETVICDIPLLFERRLVDDFDRIVLVDAPRPLRLERLTRDRALGQTEAMNMIASQMPAELKRARADFIIENEGDLAALDGACRRSLARPARARLTGRDEPRPRRAPVLGGAPLGRLDR